MEARQVAHFDADAILPLRGSATTTAQDLRGDGLDVNDQLRLGFGHLEHPKAIESQHLLREPCSFTHVRGLLVVLSSNNRNDGGTSGRVGGWSTTSDSPVQRGEPPKLLLQRVPEERVGKNRMHLDIEVPDIESLASRLLELGASRVSQGIEAEHGSHWIVMTDPEGNEFCVCDGGATEH